MLRANGIKLFLKNLFELGLKHVTLNCSTEPKVSFFCPKEEKGERATPE